MNTKATAGTAQSLSDFTGALVLYGAGKMGGAMLDGWLKLGLDPHRISIHEPNPSPQLAAIGQSGAHLNPKDDLSGDIILIAVKPQIASEVMNDIARSVRPNSLVISVMAGTTLRVLQDGLGAETAIVRAMPNTPAAIGRGISVAVANPFVSAEQKQLADQLLSAVGAVEWITDEALMDAVTAVSGSGPAYVFLLAECLARAGVAAGLPPDLAERLARATVAGSGELLRTSHLPAGQLRANVTSPNGTTAAALAVLMADDGLDPLLRRAVAAAARRSRELAG